MDSSKTDQQVPKPDEGKATKVIDDVKSAFAPHKAHPGPAIPKDFTAQDEGTKEERRAKAQELNK